ncbi:MAG: methionyl-tRNA formyltransferase [gamma proteobacterium symbiont of Taylorina sp.]|nr:methionyl-tRNA formyltransferase [gamma proteobacterium symbiont of Taylorina sp.]
MKVLFAGTPDFSAVALQALLDSEHEVVAVYTQPDRPAGRGRKLTASAVKALALEADIAVFQPLSLKDMDAQKELSACQADVMVVVAYGLILPEVVLKTPAYGCLNIHASILPRWRGAAPIQRAILAGDSHTGVTIMQMDKGLDTGDMLMTEICDINAMDSGSSLHDRLASMGAKLLLQTLDDIAADRLQPRKQDNSQATYAHKLDKKEAEIDWQSDAQLIVQKIQAFNSWPVAYTYLPGDKNKGKPLRLWQAQFITAENPKDNNASYGEVIAESPAGIDVLAKNGMVRILELQMPGKKRIMVKDFINGQSLLADVLGKQL